MLRREFLAAIASFTAASAVAKAALASAKSSPTDAVVLSKVLDERTRFERTLIECLRDGSLYPVGVTVTRRGDYRVFYSPKTRSLETADTARASAILGMYDLGVIKVERVDVYNGYCAAEVTFSANGATS